MITMGSLLGSSSRACAPAGRQVWQVGNQACCSQPQPDEVEHVRFSLILSIFRSCKYLVLLVRMSGVEVVCPGDVLATTVRFLLRLSDHDQQQLYVHMCKSFLANDFGCRRRPKVGVARM